MNTNQRGPAMDQSFVMRCSREDKASLTLAARKQGKNVSQMVREALIELHYLPASWVQDDENF